MNTQKTILLASQSKDRKRLLSNAKIPHVVIVSAYEENSQPRFTSQQLVLHHAWGKALSVQDQLGKNPELIETTNYIIIAADTVVDYNGEILGKAKNQTHAIEILKKLVGNTHTLITGVVVYDSETDTSSEYVDKTSVKFSPLNEQQIIDYITYSDEYKWRAGCYSMFDRASIFIESISGSPSNVIGLPMDFIYKELKRFGLDLLRLKG